MTKKSLFQQFLDSPISIKTMVIAVIGVWGMVLAALVVGAILFMERPGQARSRQRRRRAGRVAGPTVPSGTTVDLRARGPQANRQRPGAPARASRLVTRRRRDADDGG
jgi:hypothetical protein